MDASDLEVHPQGASYLAAAATASPSPPRRRRALLDGLPDDARTSRLALALGGCKIGSGVLLACLGMAALLLRATLGGIGGGMWAGVAALLSGAVGVLSSRLPANYGASVAFLCTAITSMSTSALLLVFAATGLAGDLNHHHDDDASATLVFPDGALNAALVALAVADCGLSAACAALVCAGACGPGRDERRARQERLRCWVDQQQIGSLWTQGAKPMFPNSTIWHNNVDLVGTPCHSCVSLDTGESTLSRKSVTGNGSDPALDGGQTRY